ncbi:MAG TPA: aldo/keto reductase [Streptosporangiaceae bacterium]|jgi:aryl-alcohol dehydrogenase-like predicted oxidoreductase
MAVSEGAAVLPSRSIGDRTVSAIGLGGAPIALAAHIPDERSAVRMVHAALDAGVTVLDTADVYSPGLGQGYSEQVFGRAVRTWGPGRDDVLIATKGGKYWRPDGEVQVNGHPEYLAQACEASLRVLGTDVIGLYQFHEPDPAVPFEESIGALADLQAAGKIRQIGISNTDTSLIRRALAVTPVASVQNRLGPGHPFGAAEIALCEQEGLAFLAYSPLKGLVTGDRFAEVARRHAVSPQQVALAWELSLSLAVIPIPGATRPPTILDSVHAAALTLSPSDLATLEGIQ